MTGAELAARISWLGVDREWTAEYLGITNNDLSRLLRDKDVVTLKQAEAITQLCEITKRAETQLYNALKDSHTPTLQIWRTNESASASPEAQGLPATWWHATAGRLLNRIPNLAIQWS